MTIRTSTAKSLLYCEKCNRQFVAVCDVCKSVLTVGAVLCKETEHWEGYTMRSYSYTHAHESCWAVFGGKPG